MVSKSSFTFETEIARLVAAVSIFSWALPACGGLMAADETQSDEMAAALDDSAAPGADIPGAEDTGVGAIGQLEQGLVTSFDVGVIPTNRACPGGTDAVRLFMDDEDRRNANNRGGYTGGIISNSNTDFFFCRVDGRNLYPLVQNSDDINSHYAVLKLGEQCPNGSLEFSRSFDNEDNNNTNTAEGNIFPNSSDRASSRTTLVFCLFRGGAETMGAFPQSFPGLDPFGYGVFAQSSFTHQVSSGFVSTDDEDTRNANRYSAGAGWVADAQRIVTAGANTTLRIAEVVPVSGLRHYRCGYALPGYGCDNGRRSIVLQAPDLTSAVDACYAAQLPGYTDFCYVLDADGGTSEDVADCSEADGSWRPGNSCCNFMGTLSCPG